MIWFDLICIGHNLLYQRKWQPIDNPLLILYNLYMNKWLLHLKYPQKKKMKLSNKTIQFATWTWTQDVILATCHTSRLKLSQLGGLPPGGEGGEEEVKWLIQEQSKLPARQESHKEFLVKNLAC